MTSSPTSLTACQRDIWTASAQMPNSPKFNIGASVQLSGDVDLNVLKDCCSRAVQRNDALHLRFAERDGTPCQWAELEPPVIEVLDFRESADPRAACLSWMQRSARRPFPLTGGRLFDIAMLRESDSVTYLYGTMHHIIVDGWGADQFLRQVLSDYAHVIRAGAPLEINAPSYLACAEQEGRYHGSSRWEQDREFYRQEFGNISPPLFPAKAVRGATDEGRRSARHTFMLDRKLIRRIREREYSVFAFVTAALAAYLSRVHRADDVVLGAPFLNRRGLTEKRTVGHFVNMLPLRATAHGKRSLHDITRQLEKATIAAKRHERLSLGDVLRALPSRTDGPRRLFDVTVSYLRLPNEESVPGVLVEKVALPHGHDQDALTVYIREYDDFGDVRVDLDYALDVFDEDFPIESAARHLQALLKAGIDRTHEPVADLPVLTPDEYEEMVRGRNATASDYPEDQTLHGLFAQQVARTPGRVAVMADGTDQPLTYAALDARANQVARALRDLGVGPDDRVAVLIERSPEMLIALFGVLKAGGAYVPIAPSYPADRIRFLLQDSGAKAVLTGSGAQQPSCDAATHVLRVDSEAVQHQSAAPPEHSGEEATARHLAYVIYTSGSTGQPKGVMVEHHSVINRLVWMDKRYPLGDTDVVLHKTPSSFDVSVWELFWWAIAGARVALLPAGGEKEPREILRTVAEQGVSVLHFVPSMFGPFLDLLESSPDALGHAASLRLVFCSGEALPPGLVDRFNRLFSSRGASAPRLVNLYGPTEATVDVTYFECPADPARPVQRVPIGRPIDNHRLYVLGPHGELQPVGLPGELCVTGAGLARGYLDRPQLTREKFVDDPFCMGERMYRTGDLARWLADGTLEYLGRIDQQVKIRGNRVEPGEVQNCLSAFPGVRGAVVIDRTSAARGVHLVGYYVADDPIDPARLRAHLGATLPEFMIPAHFLRIDHIPLTPNGKTDRKALPAPSFGSRGSGTPAKTAPRTRTEATLAAIWSDVLEVTPVGIHDNYFALGGDSILMLTIRARAADRGLHFSLTDLVSHPTIAELGTCVSAGPPAGDPPALEPFALVSGVDRMGLATAEDAYPLTRLQLGMLYHSHEHEESAVYRDVFRYTLTLRWQESAFRRAAADLVARHPVLRSSFDLAGFSQPLQIVHPQATDYLDIVDLRSVSAQEAEAEVRAHVAERSHHRYAFGQPPLHFFRAHVRASTVDLVFSFHHALLDGWSVANLIAELLQSYLHHLGADSAPVPATVLPSFAHYVREERRALSSEATRTYWRDKLRDAAPAPIESFRPHEPPAEDAFIVRTVALPQRLTEAVHQFVYTHRLPLKSVLFAAHWLTLRLMLGTDDITTGLVTHGRPEQAETEQVAGLFLNTLPIRPGTASATWLDAVRAVFQEEQDSHPHRHYPLGAMQEDRGGTPLVETAFNYVNFHVFAPLTNTADVGLSGFQVWERTNFPLLVNAVTDPRNGSVELRIDCDSRVFGASQADLFGRRYAEILHRMVQRPLDPIDFAFLADDPGDVVRLIERQALLRPRAAAVASSGRPWTYEQLDRAADRVARRLLGLGARPGARVGIAMDRSPEMIAAVVGIAKAGAVCVPLDISYPRERLAAMLEQARPFRVIAHPPHAHLVADTSLLLSAEAALADHDAPGDAPPLPAISPESTAYLLFTSGSTGRPKGVAMPHRALANLVAWQNRVPSGAVGGTTLQFAPLSFDVSFQEIFSTLCGGGTLRLISEAERRDMPSLLRMLDREDVERVFLPYVALQQLAETAGSLGIHPRRLRVLISSGEQLRVTEDIRRLCHALPGVLLENQYGPTETHVVTSYSMSGDPSGFPTLPPIGTPIDGVEIQVLDSRMRPVPDGAKGEIYLGGACLAHGYEGLPALTRERFVPHPRRPLKARLYRTGDLGRALPSGDIVCLDRADTQVKIRGFRVEPGEVELALLGGRHPGIRQVAVVPRQRENGEAVLAAFLVGDASSTDLEEVRSGLRSSLPEHLVPSHYLWLPSLPLTPSGKRDDAALREIPLAPRPARVHGTPPRDDYERDLADMVSELLEIPTPAVHDDFFDLGGTSLSAMRLVVMIEKRFSVSMPLATFVKAPTVAKLARCLRAESAETVFDPMVPIRATGSRPPLFFVHPIGGNVLCYVQLAKHLPRDRPFYALQAAGSELGTQPLRSVPELARSYVQAIRRVQPHGPYSVGGWSFGGIVAFEMARQLRQSGAEVDHLVLLDAITPTAGAGRDTAPDSLLTWFMWELLWLNRGADAPAEALPQGLDEDAAFDLILQRAVDAGVLPPGSPSTCVRRLFRVFEANWQALLDYHPEAIDQDLTLLRATAPLPEVLESAHRAVGSSHLDPANGWRAWTTGRIETVGVPGDHLQIMAEPHIAAVAQRIAELTT
ncbi:amino acid adenylation domain-containing protein [Streptomyces sp. NA02950]|uniref:amino acid adenylation domain-containing protein n=1 Tax=Streptomyces sp. NA02950 TaxID=2742137 RepID=UPI00158FD25F|nr:non-ribosomal peptide synthetase [Streptomyces sp. NA02950]QKV94598.1 amino acid adenylation domain-containing protein [Streptomyces sp. NA02950]